jgi:Rieske Fe-S protein
VVVKVTDFELPAAGPGEVAAYRACVVVSHDELRFPIAVFRHGPAEFSALWLECSHLGNELQVIGEALHCPAHGSEFSSRGAVTSGPADVPLRKFPVTIDRQYLFIDLRRPV